MNDLPSRAIRHVPPLALLLQASLALPGLGHAQDLERPPSGPAPEAPEAPEAPVTERVHDLGYVLLLTSAYIAAPIAGLGIAAEGNALGFLVYFALAPTVHAAYGNFPWAAASAVGPTGAAVLGFAAGRLLQPPCSSSWTRPLGCLEGPMIGTLVGYTSWAVLDVIFNAKLPERRLRRTLSMNALPLEDGALLSMRGAFD